MSTHLYVLARAGLVRSERRSRSVVYRADIDRLRDMMLFLAKDCCGGRPELCEPLLADLGPCCSPEKGSAMTDVVIYHNPDCGTSRNTLAMIRNAGIEPHVVEYLRTPPARALLVQLIARAGLTPRTILRKKGTPYAELGLGNPELTDDELLDAMMAHPILINRPLVVTPLGVKLCRPSDVVLDILPEAQRGAFAKEDGEVVVDADGRRAL